MTPTARATRDPRPHDLRLVMVRARRRRRLRRRRDAALPGDDPPGAPGHRRAAGRARVGGMYMLVFEGPASCFCADTTVNIDPTAESSRRSPSPPADIARTFGIEPRVAMLSFSNFGSVQHPAGGEGGRGRRSSLQRARARRSSSTARCRPTPRSIAEIARERLPASRASAGRRERAHLPEPERRQHRLQAAAAPRRRRRRSGPILVGMRSPCTCSSTAPTCRTSSTWPRSRPSWATARSVNPPARSAGSGRVAASRARHAAHSPRPTAYGPGSPSEPRVIS